jgi:hypothetical protein
MCLIPNVLEALLEEGDIQANFELVTLFRQHVQSSKLQHELNSVLLSYLMKTDSDQRIKTFDIVRFHGPGTGLSRYVANQLFLSLKVKSIPNKRSVLKELDFVLHNLYESKNPLLKITTAKKLVDLVSDFLGDHLYKVTHHRFLSIYFVPYENRMSNAAFDINTNSIVVFRTKEKKTQPPEYIFLHEFGHILHCTLFKTVRTVPESFVKFNKKINRHLFKYSAQEKLEIYADLFSIAVMLDSEYESLNPFIKTMQRVHLDEIKEYFVDELTRLK